MPVIGGYWIGDERDYPDEDLAEDALTMACLRYPERAEALQKALAKNTTEKMNCWASLQQENEMVTVGTCSLCGGPALTPEMRS